MILVYISLLIYPSKLKIYQNLLQSLDHPLVRTFSSFFELCVYNENYFPEVEKEDYVLPEEPKERQNVSPSTSSKVLKFFFSFELFSLSYFTK